MSGAEVSGLQPARHGAAAGFLLFLFFLEDCAEDEIAKPRETEKINASAIAARNARESEKSFSQKSALADGRVWIFAERASVAFREYLDQPAVKIVHRMIHDWFETSVVFAMSFLNVVFQPNADIFVFAAQAH